MACSKVFHDSAILTNSSLCQFTYFLQTAFLEVPRYEPNTDSPDDSSKTSDDSTASKALHGLELVCSLSTKENFVLWSV
jgi:hypothetical protein